MWPPVHHSQAVALVVVCVVASVGVGVPVLSSDTPLTGDTTLVVADADTDGETDSGERLLEVPVTEGESVTLAYTHSVEKTDVRDVYVVDDGTLRMVRMEFDSYGAGLPSDADVERTEDGLVATVDRSYERVHVVPGSIAGHELVVGETRYDLVALTGAGGEGDVGDERECTNESERKHVSVSESEKAGTAGSVVMFVETHPPTDVIDGLVNGGMRIETSNPGIPFDVVASVGARTGVETEAKAETETEATTGTKTKTVTEGTLT